MKLTIIFASAVAASILLSSLAFAGDPIPGVTVGAGKNPGSATVVWTENCKSGGGTPIPAEGGLTFCAKADAVATCKNKGGTVTLKGGNALCSLPK